MMNRRSGSPASRRRHITNKRTCISSVSSVSVGTYGLKRRAAYGTMHPVAASQDVAAGGAGRGCWPPGRGRQRAARHARAGRLAAGVQGRPGEGDSRSITGGGSGSDGESERNRPHAARQRLVPTPGRSPNGDHTRKGQRPAARVKRRRQKATPVSLCARAAAARSEIWLASCSIGLSTSPVSTTYTPVIRRTF